MSKKINHTDKIFVAGANGLAGSSIVRSLKKYGYGNKQLGGELLTPTRKDLDNIWAYINFHLNFKI